MALTLRGTVLYDYYTFMDNARLTLEHVMHFHHPKTANQPPTTAPHPLPTQPQFSNPVVTRSEAAGIEMGTTTTTTTSNNNATSSTDPAPISNPVVTRSEAAGIEMGSHSTQLQYVAHLLDEGKNFLIVPLDDDDSDDDENPPEPVDPLDTEESRLTTEGDIPDAVIGQIFIKTLTGKTITMSDITTGTLIIDIKTFLEGKEGIPAKNQRLKYDGKKVKD
jgi:hypothetical protein